MYVIDSSCANVDDILNLETKESTNTAEAARFTKNMCGLVAGEVNSHTFIGTDNEEGKHADVVLGVSLWSSPRPLRGNLVAVDEVRGTDEIQL